MKLSEFILEQKSQGVSKVQALLNCKALVKRTGNPWTSGKQTLFENTWNDTKTVPKEVNKLDILSTQFKNLKASCSIHEATPFYLSLWHYYNELHFGNRLPKPIFKFLKDMPTMKTLAHYIGSLNQLSFSRRFFNGKFENFCKTFVHEMCHQAVRKIDGIAIRNSVTGHRDIHGKDWQRWMRHCGLNPDRCSKTDMMDFLDEDEKAEKQDIIDTRKVQETKYARLYDIRPNTIALVYIPNEKTWIRGIIVCPEKDLGKATNKWVFATDLGSSGYRIIPENMFFECEPKDQGELNSLKWHTYVSTLRDSLLRSHVSRQKVNHAKSLMKTTNLDLRIVPPARRPDYAVVAYILTKTRAKEGKGSYNMVELTSGIYTKPDVIIALEWMVEVDGRRNVDFNRNLGSLSLTKPHIGNNPAKYCLEDFNDSLRDYYRS